MHAAQTPFRAHHALSAIPKVLLGLGRAAFLTGHDRVTSRRRKSRHVKGRYGSPAMYSAAGWGSQATRRAHNPQTGGSNPPPATLAARPAPDRAVPKNIQRGELPRPHDTFRRPTSSIKQDFNKSGNVKQKLDFLYLRQTFLKSAPLRTEACPRVWQKRTYSALRAAASFTKHEFYGFFAVNFWDMNRMAKPLTV